MLENMLAFEIVALVTVGFLGYFGFFRAEGREKES